METPLLALPSLPHLNFSYVLNKPILFIVLTAFAVFYLIVTSVLMYHWSRYGMKNAGIIFGRAVFLIVSAFLFGSAGISILYF